MSDHPPLTSEYFDDETVTLIANGLHGLPHPDGTPFMFPQHADKFPGYAENEQNRIGKMNFAIAEAFLNYLNINGRSVVPAERVAEAERHGDHTVIALHCATCGEVMLTTTMTRDGLLSIPARAINPDCATKHGAIA